MSETTSSSSSGGVGFVGLLTVLFIGLKLTGYINWSWLWVLSPLWIAACLVIAFFLIFVTVSLIVVAVKRNKRQTPKSKA